MISLEQRLTTALSGDILSSDLAALIVEIEAAINAADVAAEAERIKALDPIASPDAAKARAAMEDAAFTRDRLRTVLPRLRARLKETQAAERFARWEGEFKRVEAARDALAAELRATYPDAVAKLVNLFQRAAECDRECSRIDLSAPTGEHRRLRTVELTARGVEKLLQPDVFFSEVLRLPAYPRETGPVLAWPPPTPPASASSFVLPGPGPDWHAELKARDVARQAEAERVAAFYARQEAEREEREAAEARAANDRKIQRRRQAGWPI
jgi:hypothetical protein